MRLLFHNMNSHDRCLLFVVGRNEKTTNGHVVVCLYCMVHRVLVPAAGTTIIPGVPVPPYHTVQYV